MDERLVAYVYLFNVQRDYYECHEVGESLWLDTGRPVVLKGLIQAAVCLYHLQNGNVRGGAAMWSRARSYLKPSLPVYEGIDLVQLTHDIGGVFARVPVDWVNRIVAPDRIAALNLPVVTVRVVDDGLAQRVAAYHPVHQD
ncbi:MAG: DUF309 domain-containing protein [Firmicutes bacterium]|nr:DUF309 domain-containing protein [Bacillota bacterium]